MQITCAECGCVVDRGEIVGPCGQHPECCCRDLGSRDDTRERLADTVHPEKEVTLTVGHCPLQVLGISLRVS